MPGAHAAKTLASTPVEGTPRWLTKQINNVLKLCWRRSHPAQTCFRLLVPVPGPPPGFLCLETHPAPNACALREGVAPSLLSSARPEFPPFVNARADNRMCKTRLLEAKFTRAWIFCLSLPAPSPPPFLARDMRTGVWRRATLGTSGQGRTSGQRAAPSGPCPSTRWTFTSRIPWNIPDMRCGRKWAAARLTAKGLLQFSASLVQTSYAQVYPRTFPPTLSFTLPALVESARHLVLLSAATGGQTVWRPRFTISLTFHSRCLWFASSYNSRDTIVANSHEQAAHRLQVNHPAQVTQCS